MQSLSLLEKLKWRGAPKAEPRRRRSHAGAEEEESESEESGEESESEKESESEEEEEEEEDDDDDDDDDEDDEQDEDDVCMGGSPSPEKPRYSDNTDSLAGFDDERSMWKLIYIGVSQQSFVYTTCPSVLLPLHDIMPDGALRAGL